MKLHLPNGLRKALLACLAALSLSTALPVTVASGTATLVFLSQQVRAEFTGPNVTWSENPEQWVQDMTISGSMVVDMTTDANRDNLVFRASGGDVNLKLTWSGDSDEAADAVEFRFKEVGAFNNLWLDGHGRYFITSDTTSFSNQIRDIYISGAQLLVDSSASEITDWVANIHVGSSSAAGGAGAFAVFKNFTTSGALDVVEEATITFGWSDEAANMTFDRIGGEGLLNINENSNGTLTLTNGGEVKRGIDSSNAGVTVAFGGTLKWEGNGQIAGTLKALPSAKLELSGGLNVGCISGTLSELVWNDGGMLSINYNMGTGGPSNPEFVGSLSVETLTLNASTAFLMIDVTGGGTISIGTLAGTGTLMVGLYGVTDAMVGTDGYALFPTWNPEWAGHFMITGETETGATLQLSAETGKITTEAPPDVAWDAPTMGALTWEHGGTDGWKDGGTFRNSASVTMTAQGNAGEKTVTTDVVSVSNLTITGNGSTYTFTPKESYGGTVTVHAVFTIGEGCHVVFASQMELQLANGSSIVMGDNSTLVVSGYDMLTMYDGDAQTSITHTGSGNATLTIDMTGDTGNGKFQGVGMQFGEGVVLEIKGRVDSYQFVSDINVADELKLSGQEIVVQGTNTIGTLSVDGNTKLTFDGNHNETTFTKACTLEGTLDLRGGTITMGENTLTIKDGIHNHDVENDPELTSYGEIHGKDLVLTVQEANGREWNGTLNLSGTLTMSGGTQTLNASGHTEEQDASLSVANVNLQSGTLKWGRADFGGTVTGELQFNGGTFALQGGTLSANVNVQNGGTLQLDGGKFTATGWTGTLTGLVLAEGTTLDLGSRDVTFNFGAITLNGNATLNLGGTAYSSLQLGLTGLTAASGALLTVTLTRDFLQDIIDNHDGTYELFTATGGWQDAWENSIKFTQVGDYAVAWGRDGSITVVNTAAPYNWEGNGDDVWSKEKGHANWSGGSEWKEGSNATFDGEGETVEIQGEVSPRKVVVTSGQWTFTGNGSVTTQISDGLTLSGDGTSVKFTGSGKKSFGGKADALGIHLGAGTELIIGQGGEGYGDTHWVTDGTNYAEGEGSIVLEGVTIENNSGKQGLLFAFLPVGDEVTDRSIGALKLRSSATLTMNEEMGAETSGHSLGYFKEIYVEDGSTLNDASGALGKKIHTGNVLHLAGRGTSDNGALIISHKKTEDWRQVDWNIVADSDALISVENSKTFKGSLGAQGHTLTIQTAAGQTTTLAGAFTAGGQSGALEFTGGGNVTLGTGFSATGGGTLKVSGGTVTSNANDLSGATLELGEGTLICAQNGVMSLGGVKSTNGNMQVQFSEGVQLKIAGGGDISGFINLMITGVEDTNAFLDTLKGDGYQLFKTDDGGHWESSWSDIFDASVEGLDPGSGFIIVDAEGTLKWTEEVVGGELYWGSAPGENTLQWGNAGEGGEKFDTAEGSGDQSAAWRNGKIVHFKGDNTTERTVTLVGDISTGFFDATGKFKFTSDGEHDLRIGGKGMEADHAELTFESNIDLTVVSDEITLTDSTLSVAGTAMFNGKVTGDGTIAAVDEGKITITGGISEFTGTLNTGTAGTITLSGEATAGDVSVRTIGSGVLDVKSGEEGTRLTGVIGTGGDTLTLTNTGTGMLYVAAGASSSTSAKLNGGTGGITLGDSTGAVDWAGSEVIGGTITLANVTLADGGLKASDDCAINVDTATASPIALAALRDAAVATPPGGVVDVNGMDAGQLSDITINDGGQLKNVTGTYTADANHKLTLYFSVDNLSATETPAEGKYALIVGKDGGNFTLNASNRSAVTLDISAVAADIYTVLSEAGNNEAYLHVLQGGTLNMGDLAADNLAGHDVLSAFIKGFGVGVVGGNIKLTGDVGDVFVVPEKLNGAVDAAMLKNMKAVVVGTGRSVSFTTDGDAKLPNVLGGRGSSMTLQKSEKAAGRVTFTFDNSVADVAEVNPPYPEFGGNTVEGMDTTFLGRITADEGVNIAKTGEGTLTVGDNFTVSDGETRIEEGSLRLLGEQNEMKGGLVFAYESDPVEGKERGLLLENGMTEIGGMTDGGSKGAEVRLSGGAELTLSGESTLANTEMIGGEGGGTLYLEKGADLTFTGDKGITGVGVEMEDAVLDLGTSKSTLPALNGTGTLKTAEGGELTVGGGTFTGTLESSGKGAGTLAVVEGATFTLDKVTSSAGMGVRLGAGSTLNVNVGDGTLKFGNVNLGEDGRLKLDYGEKGLDTALVQGNITGWGEEKGTVEFHSDGPVADGPIGTGFTLADGLPTDPESLAKHFKFTGLGNFLKDHHLSVNSKNKEVELTTSEATENKFERAIPGAGKNAHAGAAMLWESLRDITPEAAFFAMFQDPSSDYARLINSLVQCMDTQATAGLDRTFSAAAGSAISTLAPALSQDIHRQLTAIRNRTTTMASDSLTDGYDELPLWHAWLNAEGAYHKLDADGLAPGFTLHNWGGTVGVDVDISRTTTMGLAITAMYGDLEPDSADSATGDMDTYYLSAFARLAHGAWIHTLVVSGGIADVSLNRTVNYGGGSYRTDGSTDGCAFGAMYEVGYTGFVNKRGTVALQPIANVELRHVALSGYTETGSDAGVDADDMDMTVLTLGVGARVQAAVSANAFNRSTVLEGRLLVKTDIGDRSGTVENAIVKHASRAEVESAEVGAVGVEAGIGISIPIDAQSGSIFADASLEWRDNWVSTNATLGYRVNF